MAKLRMTYKNLKALRKSKEYQALLVDLVNESIVPKSVAEALLGYNIPSDLIPKISGSDSGNISPVSDSSSDDSSSSSADDASSSSSDDSSSSSANDSSSSSSTEPESTSVIVPVKVSVDSAEPVVVGTYTIPSSWGDIDYNLFEESDNYIFGNNFTPNENWNAIDELLDNCSLDGGVYKNTNGEEISWGTLPSELPEGTYIAVSINSVSDSSSSSS